MAAIAHKSHCIAGTAQPSMQHHPLASVPPDMQVEPGLLPLLKAEVGTLYCTFDQFGIGLEELRAAAALCEEDKHVNSITAATVHCKLGVALLESGQMHAAQPHFDLALSLSSPPSSSSPSSSSSSSCLRTACNHPASATIHKAVGEVMELTGSVDAALAHYNTALRIRRRVLASNSMELATSLRDAAAVREGLGRLKSALRHYTSAVHVIACATTAPDQGTQLVNILTQVSRLHCRLAQADAAQCWIVRAMRLFVPAQALQSEDLKSDGGGGGGGGGGCSADALNSSARPWQAPDGVQGATALASALAATGRLEAAKVLTALARIAQLRGCMPVCVQYLQGAVDVNASVAGLNHAATAVAQRRLGLALAAVGKTRAGERLCKAAADALQAMLGPGHPEARLSRQRTWDLAQCIRQEDDARARVCAGSATELFENTAKEAMHGRDMRVRMRLAALGLEASPLQRLEGMVFQDLTGWANPAGMQEGCNVEVQDDSASDCDCDCDTCDRGCDRDRGCGDREDESKCGCGVESDECTAVYEQQREEAGHEDRGSGWGCCSMFWTACFTPARRPTRHRCDTAPSLVTAESIV